MIVAARSTILFPWSRDDRAGALRAVATLSDQMSMLSLSVDTHYRGVQLYRLALAFSEARTFVT